MLRAWLKTACVWKNALPPHRLSGIACACALGTGATLPADKKLLRFIV
jgi:hypothetical protein